MVGWQWVVFGGDGGDGDVDCGGGYDDGGGSVDGG